MHGDDLMHRVNALSEKIRVHRAHLRPHHPKDTGDLAALETQLRDVWSAIRASRAPTRPLDQFPERRTNAKWQ